MSFFSEALATLASFGFYDFFLPWVLILAVVFGVLQKSGAISDQTSVNATISVAVAFLTTIILHSFFIRFFNLVGILLAGFLALIIFAAMFGFKPNELLKDVKEWNKNAIPGLIILGTIIIFFLALGFRLALPNLGYIINTPLVSLLIVAIILVIIVKFIAGGHKEGGGGH